MTGRFLSEDPYWNTSNMIYGDNQPAKTEIVINENSKSANALNNLIMQSAYDSNAMDIDGIQVIDNINYNSWNASNSSVNVQHGYLSSLINDLNSGANASVHNILRFPDMGAIRQSSNLYVYSMSNPQVLHDPSGENAIALGAGIGLFAGPPGAVVGAVVGVIVTAAIIIVAAEHSKKGTTNPAKRNKHEEGQARKNRDSGGEKGDARRKPNPNKRKH